MRLPTAYSAVRTSAYRRVLGEQLLFETALTVFEVALFWDIVQATQKSSAVGTLFALIVLPAALLAAPIGRLTDRFGARPLIATGTLLAAATSAAGAVVVEREWMTFTTGFALATFAGVSLGLWAVPCQVMVSRTVASHVRSGAIALSLAPSGLSAILGGALAGWMLRTAGSLSVYVLACLCMLAAASVAVSLPRITSAHVISPDASTFVRTARWILSQRILTTLCLLAMVASLCIVGRVALFPALVSEVLHEGPEQLGILVSATGVGTLIAALTAETVAHTFGRGTVALGALALAAGCLIGLAVSRDIALSAVLAVACSTAAITYQASAAMVVHLSAHPDDRGRVVGAYDLSRLLLVPVGTISVGHLADAIGPVATCGTVAGITITAVALLGFVSRSALREPPHAVGEPVRL